MKSKILPYWIFDNCEAVSYLATSDASSANGLLVSCSNASLSHSRRLPSWCATFAKEPIMGAVSREPGAPLANTRFVMFGGGRVEHSVVEEVMSREPARVGVRFVITPGRLPRTLHTGIVCKGGGNNSQGDPNCQGSSGRYSSLRTELLL